MPSKCPKCDGEMREGFIMELGDSDQRSVSRWVAGAPVDSLWSGLKISDKAQHDVRTYRCARCGFLESYAK